MLYVGVFIAPEQFSMEPDVKAHLEKHRIPYAETTRLAEVLPALDAIYITRMQTEWDTAGESNNVELSQFSIGTPELSALKPDAIIMHPLPRGREIDPAVDQDPRAMYWRQERPMVEATNGERQSVIPAGRPESRRVLSGSAS